MIGVTLSEFFLVVLQLLSTGMSLGFVFYSLHMEGL